MPTHSLATIRTSACTCARTVAPPALLSTVVQALPSAAALEYPPSTPVLLQSPPSTKWGRLPPAAAAASPRGGPASAREPCVRRAAAAQASHARVGRAHCRTHCRTKASFSQCAPEAAWTAKLSVHLPSVASPCCGQSSGAPIVTGSPCGFSEGRKGGVPAAAAVVCERERVCCGVLFAPA